MMRVIVCFLVLGVWAAKIRSGGKVRAECSPVPESVKDLSASVSGNSVTLSWQPPEDLTCISGYSLVFDNDAQNLNPGATSHTFRDLQYCNTYEFALGVVFNDATSDYSNGTAEIPVNPPVASVQNLQLTIVGSVLNVTWEPPANVEKCIQHYVINENSKEYTTTETFYEFSPLIGCKTYSLQVKPWISQALEGNINRGSIDAGDVPTQPPTLKDSAPNQTWTDTTWTLQSYAENECKVSGVRVECRALPEDNQDFDWIVTYKEAVEIVTDSAVRPPVTVLVPDLSEFTNYTCRAIVVNSGGESNASEPFEFQTLEGVPSEPLSVQVLNVSATELMVLWHEPHKIPGIIVDYRVVVEPTQSLHYIPDECEIEVGVFSEDVEPDVREFFVSDLLPDFLYTVRVDASTRVGRGADGSAHTQTLTAEPEPPRTLNYTWYNEQTAEYNVTAGIIWSLPCNTNGELDSFEVQIDGNATYDPSEGYHDTFRVPRNDPITHRQYEYFLRNVSASFEYWVTVKAISTDDYASDVESLNFLSPDGFPSAPTIENVTDVSDSSFTVVWREPEVKNGLLLTYNVSIEASRSLYPIPDDCDRDLRSFWFETDGDSLSYVFLNAWAYYEYTVTVSAATSAGFGFPSQSFTVSTEEAEPEMARNLSLNFAHLDLTDYNVPLTISWKLPCKTNGDLDHFRVSINSTSLSGETQHVETYVNSSSENFEYSVVYPATQAAYVYDVDVNAILTSGLEGVVASSEESAPDGYPGPPSVKPVADSQTNSFEVTWEEPSVTNGRLKDYRVVITSLGPLYDVPDDDECMKDTDTYTYYVDAINTSFVFEEAQPFYGYDVRVRASTSIGYGGTSSAIRVETSDDEPEQVRVLSYELQHVRSEDYSTTLSVAFSPPCNTYGQFLSYGFYLSGEREGHEAHQLQRDYNATNVTVDDLRAEYVYTLLVTVKTEHFESLPSVAIFLAPAGVPPKTNESLPEPSLSEPQVSFTLTHPFFDEGNGKIIYYAVILSAEDANLTATYGFWDGTAQTWPPPTTTTEQTTEEIAAYQATPLFWNPFADNNTTDYTFSLGTDECYGDGYCNKKLEPDVMYSMIVRGFTSEAYRDSQPMIFDTYFPKGVDRNLVIVIVCSVSGALVLVGMIFLLWRRRDRWIAKKPSVLEARKTPAPIPMSEFPRHYAGIKQDYSKLKVEYTLLGTKTADIQWTRDAAELPENKSKNRYTNILPFDETRVVLTTDSNENGSSYINASYIKGFSGETEYIATQGPLEHTCLDFWRMVLQEKVTVIAMVAHFIEQNKDKCFKYFPLVTESMEIGDGIEIRCVDEQNFGTYIVRTLFVEKSSEKCEVTHLQFVDWPDFGCPVSTETMLQYCRIMRDQQRKAGGMIVVHCSAGVGRSGTLIAIDVLLQAISVGADVDIFNTVLNLRKQRDNMVQTEKQYMYIHTCVKDAIDSPPKAAGVFMNPFKANGIEIPTEETDATSTKESAF